MKQFEKLQFVFDMNDWISTVDDVKRVFVELCHAYVDNAKVDLSVGLNSVNKPSANGPIYSSVFTSVSFLNSMVHHIGRKISSSAQSTIDLKYIEYVLLELHSYFGHLKHASTNATSHV